MTYCENEVNLLAKAGRELAEELLPVPFQLWFSDHSTGRQMTIAAIAENRAAIYVWRGSVWHSSQYEFNDHGHTPGLQPDFEFARPVIEKYFQDVRDAVAKRDAERAARKAQQELEAVCERQAVIDAVRRQLAATSPSPAPGEGK